MSLTRRFPPGAQVELDSGVLGRVLYAQGHRRYVHTEYCSAWFVVSRLHTVALWPGQRPGVHDHKPYHDECPQNCPGRLPADAEYRVRAPRAQARHA